ncbi:hypothetical protein Tco_1264339 [Tanacetum coccineum]
MHIRQLLSCFFTMTELESQLWCLASFFLPYGETTIADIQTVFRNRSWNARHVCWFLGEYLHVVLEQVAEFYSPFSDKLPPILTVCLGYSGWMAIFILAFEVFGEDLVGAPTTILHSAGITVLLCSVTTPSGTGNLSIPCAVDGIACIFLRPRRLMIPLYGEGDWTTMKFIMALVECSSSPSDTISEICLSGQDISQLNPKSDVVAGIIYLLISGWSFLKQCSYRTSDAEPPSTYIRWMHSSMLWPLSPWNSQNLFLFQPSTGLDIGSGALNFTLSIARISFGVLISGVNLSGLLFDFCLSLKSDRLSTFCL